MENNKDDDATPALRRMHAVADAVRQLLGLAILALILAGIGVQFLPSPYSEMVSRFLVERFEFVACTEE
jgi:hypothetical protein